jgi:hypothetical protein
MKRGKKPHGRAVHREKIGIGKLAFSAGCAAFSCLLSDASPGNHHMDSSDFRKNRGKRQLLESAGGKAGKRSKKP